MNLKLASIWSLIIAVSNCKSSAQGQKTWTVKMHQNEEGQRSIKSNTTVISEIYYNGMAEMSPEAVIYVYMNLSDSYMSEDEYVGDRSNAFASASFIKWKNNQFFGWTDYWQPDFNMTLSDVEWINGNEKRFTWYFPLLTKKYNKLALFTSISDDGGNIIASNNHTELVVLACTNLTVYTPDKNSFYEITSHSPGYFGDVGTCKCPDQMQVLVGTNGIETNKTAKCSEYASWEPCQSEELQCWSAPRVSNVSQINKTAGDLDPFKCIYTDGYPNATKILYKVDNVTLSTKYTLKSSDNGKNLTCEVVTNYTQITGTKSKSGVEVIIVFYPPEKANLSTNSINIVSSMNRTVKLSFYFSANPHSEKNLSTHFKYSNSENAVPDGLFSWVDNITTSSVTQYTRVFVVNLTSADETETYAVCANSTSPEGGNCAELTFKSGNPTSEGGTSIGIIIGVVVGVLALLVIVAVIYFMRRNHGNIKEERINEIYEASPGPGPTIETVYTGTGENSRSEMTTNVAYEASPHQPEIQDVYTTVNREDKKKGRTEKDETKNRSAAATSAEENVPAVTDVYAMVKK